MRSGREAGLSGTYSQSWTAMQFSWASLSYCKNLMMGQWVSELESRNLQACRGIFTTQIKASVRLIFVTSSLHALTPKSKSRSLARLKCNASSLLRMESVWVSEIRSGWLVPSELRGNQAWLKDRRLGGWMSVHAVISYTLKQLQVGFMDWAWRENAKGTSHIAWQTGRWRIIQNIMGGES